MDNPADEADNPFNQAQFEQAVQPIPDGNKLLSDSIIDDVYETPISQNKKRNSDAYESDFWKNSNTGIANNPPYTHNSNGHAYENNSEFISVPKPSYIAHGQISSNIPSSTTNTTNNQSLNQTFTSVKKSITNLFKNDTKSDIKQSNETFNTNVTHDLLDEREKKLEKKEKRMTHRKERLEKVQREMNTSNAKKLNWPFTRCPLTFHSIKQEIPPHARSHMRRMYTLVLLTFLTYAWNVFCMLTLYFTSVVDDTELLLSVLYLVCGVCGSWRMWYRQIYYALRDYKVIKWWIFFFFFLCHCGFCAVLACGFESVGGAGFGTLIKAFNADASFAGICCMISAMLWTLVTIASALYFKKSLKIYRQRTGDEDIQKALTKEAVAYSADHIANQLV